MQVEHPSNIGFFCHTCSFKHSRLGQQGVRHGTRVLRRPSSIRQHMSSYVSIRQNTSAYVRTGYVRIRQHTSTYVNIRQHTSAYVSIRRSYDVPSRAALQVSVHRLKLTHEFSLTCYDWYSYFFFKFFC